MYRCGFEGIQQCCALLGLCLTAQGVRTVLEHVFERQEEVPLVPCTGAAMGFG
jgi:hypothetical protein